MAVNIAIKFKQTVGLCLLFTSLMVHAEPSQSLHFVRIDGVAEQIVGEQLLRAVYQRLGIPITITPMPALRATYEATSGHKDGEMLRIESFGLGKPSLIRIPVPIAYIKTRAFAFSDFPYDQQALSSYRIAIVRGVQHTTDAVKGYPNVIQLTNTSSLMRFLYSRRADVILSADLNGRYLIQQASLKDLVPVGEVIQVNALYHYVHKKHLHLVPKIEATIRLMQESGELKVLWEQGVKDLMSMSLPVH